MLLPFSRSMVLPNSISRRTFKLIFRPLELVTSPFHLPELNRTHYYSPSRIPVTVYLFAGPRMGNAAFRGRCLELGLRILHVVNVHDLVTKIPGVIFNENFRVWENLMDIINSWSYSHVGVELALNHKLHAQFFHGKSYHPSVHNLGPVRRITKRNSV